MTIGRTTSGVDNIANSQREDKRECRDQERGDGMWLYHRGENTKTNPAQPTAPPCAAIDVFANWGQASTSPASAMCAHQVFS